MARIKDTIIEEQDIGVNVYGKKTPQVDLSAWGRNERERQGISRNRFTDEQISHNPIRD